MCVSIFLWSIYSFLLQPTLYPCSSRGTKEKNLKLLNLINKNKLFGFPTLTLSLESLEVYRAMKIPFGS